MLLYQNLSNILGNYVSVMYGVYYQIVRYEWEGQWFELLLGQIKDWKIITGYFPV